MDDFVLRVKQVGNYPLKTAAAATDAILLQEGGLGGPYKYTTQTGLVGPITDPLSARIDTLQIQFSSFNQTLSAFGADWTDQFNSTIDQINKNNQFALNSLFDNSVQSFNGQTGHVKFTSLDLINIGGAPLANPQLRGLATLDGSPLASQATVAAQIEAAAKVNPIVNLFNGRAGVVELTLVDVMNAFFTGRPITPTPRSSDISQRIANTRWVTDRDEELYGSLWADVSSKYAPLNTPHLIGVPTSVTPDINDNSNQIATTAWVLNKLTAIGAGVLSWNNRSGLVNLLWSDVAAVGGAPLVDPIFSGDPQAPTRAITDNSASIATTAFVQAAAVAQITALAATVAATYAPLASPALTGTPTAPTATPATTNTTQIATTAFVHAVAGDYLPLAGGSLTGKLTVGTALAANDVALELDQDFYSHGAAVIGKDLQVRGASDLDGVVNCGDQVIIDYPGNTGAALAVHKLTGAVGLEIDSDSSGDTGPALQLKQLITGSLQPAFAVNSDGAARIDYLGTAQALYILSRAGSGSTGLWVDAGNGVGGHFEAWDAGGMALYAQAATNATALEIGAIGATQSYTALEVYRGAPDTTLRYAIQGDGSQQTTYDGTATALDINATGANSTGLKVRNGASELFKVDQSGVSARAARLGAGNISGGGFDANLTISNVGAVTFLVGSNFNFYGYTPWFGGGIYVNVYDNGPAYSPLYPNRYTYSYFGGSNIYVQPAGAGGVNTGEQVNIYSYGTNFGVVLQCWQKGLSINAVDQALWLGQGNAYKPGGGSWTATSDARTKTDVHDYTHGLNEIKQLKPMTFRYNGRYRIPETGQVYVGLAAEEVEGVMPEMVRKVKGKLDYDDEETDVLHLDATALTYALVNAVKELTAKVEELEAKLK